MRDYQVAVHRGERLCRYDDGDPCGRRFAAVRVREWESIHLSRTICASRYRIVDRKPIMSALRGKYPTDFSPRLHDPEGLLRTTIRLYPHVETGLFTALRQTFPVRGCEMHAFVCIPCLHRAETYYLLPIPWWCVASFPSLDDLSNLILQNMNENTYIH